MRKPALVGILLSIMLVGTAFAGTPTTVTLLDRGEPHDGLVFLGDYLYVGKSRTDFNSDYRVEIYDRDLKLVTTIPLKHSATHISKYSDTTVLVVGTVPKGWEAHTSYTVITPQNGKFRHRTVDIPNTAWAYAWLGTVNGKEYFADPGGNGADDTRDLNAPAQTIFALGQQTKYLPTRMRLPTGGVAYGDNLFVVQRESMDGNRTNVGQVNAQTGELKYLLGEGRNDLRDVTKLSNAGLFAVTEEGADNILILDSADGSLVSETKTEPYPRSIASTGNCIVVGNQADRSIEVFDATDPKALVRKGSVKVELPLEEFAWLSKIEADLVSGRLFGRSNFACNPLSETCDKDWNRVIAIDAKELLAGCAQ